MFEAIVVGGGIVGASTAYHLVRNDVETLLVDRGDDGRATRAGAGILCPTASSRSESEEWYDFAIDAVRYYPELVERLETEQAGRTGYAETGLLAVAVSDDELEPFQETLERANRRAKSYPERASTVREVTPDEAVEMCPAITRPERAMYVEEGARVNGQQFTDALLRAASERGFQVASETVTDVRVESDRVTGVETGRSTYDAETVVVSGGAWSPEFEEGLGVELPVEPHRGQIAHLDPEYRTGDWPVVNGFRGHYVVPWPDRVVAGATREDDAGFDPSLTVGGVQSVLTEATRVAPGLETAEIEDLKVGLRPASEDGLPILGPVPGIAGAYVATGHGATGLQLGPYSGKLVAEAIHGELPEELAPYLVDRFD